MKEVLSFIEQKKQEFARLPFFDFMQDSSIDPRIRLGWAPCAAFFIMSFGELNKSVFRDDLTSDPIQKIINTHTQEDDHHWVWFLQDLEKLGFDRSLKFSETLKFLWGEETQVSRWVIHQISSYAFRATPIQKLVIIEVLEATGNIVFECASNIAMELQEISGKQYDYFGSFHLGVETGHTTGSANIGEILCAIDLTQTQKQELLDLAKKVFAVISELTDSLLAYAQKNQNNPSSYISSINHQNPNLLLVQNRL